MSDAMLDTGPSRGMSLAERSRPFIWGLASQVASSATNLGLSVVAGLALGPSGLGAVFVGFSFYLLALGFQRALVTDPLVTASSALEGEARSAYTRSALTTTIAWSCASTIVLAIAGMLVSGEVGRGLLLFVPWLIAALVQDFWRTVLFRDGRGAEGALNDVVWVAVMAAALPLAFLSRSAPAVVGCWGLGATAGMAVGFLQTRLRPDSPLPAVRWWRRHAWPLGRWLSAESVVYALGGQGVVFVLAAILSTQSLGGLRAVQTLFAPLTLLVPALALPGLPELSRRVAVSAERARRLASYLGGVATVLAGGYLAIALLAGGRLLSLVFGEGFGAFDSLIVPIAAGQLFIASTLGFGLMLKAEARGKALLSTRVVGSAATFGLASVLATVHDVEGAAWGMAIGSGVNALLLLLFAIRGATRRSSGTLFQSFTLSLFRLVPPRLYQQIRRLPVVKSVGVRLLDLFLPERGFIEGVRIREGPLKGMMLELDPRVHKEMVTGHYEPHVQVALEALIRPGDTCFDVGAHVGYFSLVMARAASGGRVVSFEPDPLVAGALERNLDRNAHLTGAAAQAITSALGATKGTASFSRGTDSSTGRLVAGSGQLEVEVTTLDHAAAEYGVPRLTKIDVEGGELDILQGASAVLKRGQTVFVIEVHSSEAEEQCTRLLEGYGYMCRRLEAEARTDCHILAVPRGAAADRSQPALRQPS